MTDQTIIEQVAKALKEICRRRSIGMSDCIFDELAEAAIATLQSSAVLPSEAMIEAGAKAFCETQSLNPRKLAEVVYTAMRATTPTAPVQDDDAEWLRLHNMAYGFPAATAARLERIASRLSPTPETGLVAGTERA